MICFTLMVDSVLILRTTPYEFRLWAPTAQKVRLLSMMIPQRNRSDDLSDDSKRSRCMGDQSRGITAG